MPAIADQVATLEHDLADALAQIDTLTAANAALASANASVNRDNIALQLEVNDMKHYVDDTRAMVEQLAGSALDMLRASRRQVGSPLPAEVIPFAPKNFAATQAILDRPEPPGVDPTPNPNWNNAAALYISTTELQQQIDASLDAKIATLPDAWPAGDSGDEQPATPLPPHAGPMLVEHSEEKLPIFLTRDWPYPGAKLGGPDRAIFG